ncbi:phage portal protein [Paenibacillus sp. S-38]|uniref:phage portal protein n=1 Tax=Paenibacillus sp. S-38 TaxID=3416710 RepID=UPI003CE7AA39
MGLIQRIKSLFGIKNQTVNRSLGEFEKWFSPHNIFDRSGQLDANNETIFSAVSRLSNSMASLPLKLYREYRPVRSPIAQLLEYGPNPNMTGFDFIRTLEAFRNTRGNGYALIERDSRYQVKALWLLNPKKVKPVQERTTKELWYEMEGEDGLYYVHNMDMIHVKHFHTLGYEGISPLDVLRNTINYDSQVKQFSLSQMESGIKASFILKLNNGLLNDDKKKALLKNFSDFYAKNGSGVIVMDSGQDLKELKQDIIDLKVFEVERITRSRVAAVFSMPPHMLGDFSQTSFSSMEQQSLEYVQITLLPIVRMYEQEFNRKLLTSSDQYSGTGFKFNMNGLLRGDTQTRGEFYFKGIRSGWFTPNEVRAFEELPPQAGGDKLFLSGDLYPLDTPLEARKGVKTE